MTMLARLWRRIGGRSPSPAGGPEVDAAQLFTDFFRRNKWGGRQSLSGTGSDADQTRVIVRELPLLLRRLGVRRVLDVPCGDFAWMKQVDLAGIDYLGADIVAPLIEANRRRHAQAGVEFRVLDLTRDRLPAVDLVLCRDCLVHLSFAQAQQALANIAASGARYLLTTTFTGRSENADIPTGKWRALNLQRPPFDLPPPLEIINEQCTEKDGRYADKSLGLWPLTALRRA
jgi:SAM-dependent methyltransferase